MLICLFPKKLFDECPVGYRTPCLFSLFGQFCQTLCNCVRSECSNIQGCYFTKSTDEKVKFKAMLDLNILCLFLELLTIT